MSDHNRNWDLVLPTTQIAYNRFVNKIIGMSLFEVVYGYKLIKPLYLFSIFLHAIVSESTMSFAHKIQGLHVDITKQIQASNAQYKL